MATIEIVRRRRQPSPSPIFRSYWSFAAERQRLFRARLGNYWDRTSVDPILGKFKFTNAYRASDRTSQFLLRHVIYDSPQRSFRDTFARVVLFKFFNRIDTWRSLENALGPLEADRINPIQLSRELNQLRTYGRRIYSAAYIMPSPRQFGFSSKHENHVWLLRQMLDESADQRVLEARSMADAYQVLRSYRSIGPFLAYQLVTDLNYGPHLNFSEEEFVEPGPGAKSGLRKCFEDAGGLTDEELIHWTMEGQEREFERYGETFQDLWGRPLKLVDCQNLYCEVDKYARVAHPEIVGPSGRRRIKQRFRPKSEPITAWYPPKWGINEAVQDWLDANSERL